MKRLIDLVGPHRLIVLATSESTPGENERDPAVHLGQDLSLTGSRSVLQASDRISSEPQSELRSEIVRLIESSLR